MPSYELNITVHGRDRASKPLGGVGSALSRIGQIAVGSAIGIGLAKIGESLLGLGKQAIGSAAEMQNLTIAFETLVAKEIARGEEVTQSREAVLHLTDAEKTKLQELTLEYDTLGARMNEQRERVRQMTQEWTDQGLATQTAKARLAEMQYEYGNLGREIDELQAKEGKLVTVQDKVRINTMELSEALELAGPRAGDLKKQLRDLALVSPFEYQDIANIVKTNLAFGATTENVIDLTKAMTDVGAGLGLTGEMFDRMSYNLAQAVIAGDLTEMNLRQLRMTGLDLAEVLEGELGLSIEEVRKQLKAGKLTMADVSRAFMKYADKNFAGAAERMSRSFSGLQSSFNDLFFFAGSDLLTPALETVTERLGGLFDKAREGIDSGVFVNLGEKLGEFVGSAFDFFEEAADTLSPFFQAVKELAGGDVDDFLLNFAAGIGDLGEKVLGWDAAKASEISLAIYEIGQKAAEQVGAVGDFLATMAETAWQTTGDWFVEHGPQLGGDFERMGTALGTLLQPLKDFFGTVAEDGPGATQILQAIIDTGLGELSQATGLLADSLERIAVSWEYFFGEEGQSTQEDAKESWEGWSIILDEVGRALDRSARPFTKIREETENWYKIGNALSSWIEEDFVPSVKDLWTECENLGKAADELIDKTLKNLKQWFEDIAKAADELAQSILDLVGQFLAFLGLGIPEWVQGHSPPPLARWFGEIATEAERLGRALRFPVPGALAVPAAMQLQGATMPMGAGHDARGGGDTYHIYVNDRGAAAIFWAEVRGRGRRRLSRRLGVGG